MLRSLVSVRRGSSSSWKPITGVQRFNNKNHLSTAPLANKDDQLQVDPSVLRKPIRRLLIANRGEIACRIIRSARKLGIETVAVFSDADRRSMHVAMADQAYHIGPSPATESYLVSQKLLDVAQRSASDAVHPGYGFLSENFEFAGACAEAGVKFVGPSPSAIRSMGIKSLSKAIMSEAGVPVIPGYHNDGEQAEEALLEKAKAIGFPVMIKAVRGGGGKGMRVALDEGSFLEQLRSAKREAAAAFGDDIVLLEKYLRRPRHIEVQVFGDQHGNVVSLLERDCSSQRRHQKVIEEAPAPHITAETRHSLGVAAVRAAKAVNYEGAGTVEFIYDTEAKGGDGFYFMEMNTRLQVEHPVTEMVTGLDLVEWQLRVASGEPLPRPQSDFIQPRGHAFEARIYAEDAESNFMPCTGKIESLVLPVSTTAKEEIRIETGVRPGDEVSVFYDPMIAKLVVWSADRPSALAKLRQALAEYRITGLKTNVDYLRRLAGHEKFTAGDVYTDFIADYSSELVKPKVEEGSKSAALYKALAAIAMLQKEKMGSLRNTGNDLSSPFSLGSEAHFLTGSRAPRRLLLVDPEQPKKINNEVDISLVGVSNYSITVAGQHSMQLSLESYEPESGELVVTDEEGIRRKYTVLTNSNSTSVFTKEYGVLTYEQVLPAFVDAEEGGSGSGDAAAFDGRTISSPMPALVEKVLVTPGTVVKSGDTVAILTAMKMEHVIRASFGDEEPRTVEKVFAKAGDSVAKGAKLVQFTEV